MLDAIHWHLSEELLDEFVRRTLSSEEQIAVVEEHLLLCERCRDKVCEIDDFVKALRHPCSAGQDPL